MKTFLSQWLGAYRDGARLFVALPWAAAAMIAVELVQHVVEARLGMFGGPDQCAVAAADPIRLVFGWAKMAVFFAVGLVALRYFALGQAREAMRPSGYALRRFAGVVLFQTVIFAAILHARGLLALVGLPITGITPLRVTLSLAQQLLEPLLFLWYVNAAVGTRGFGPVESARRTGALWFWALALTFLTRLPLNAAHQLLNRVPASTGPVLLWSALAVDAAVVVLIAGSLAAIQVRIARHIAARRGIALLAEAA